MAVNLGTAVAYLELDTSKFTSGFASALNDLKVFQDKSATVGQKLNGLSSSMNTVGKGLTAHVTTPLLGIGAAAVKVTADFDSQMSKVKAISGATGTDFDSLKEKAIEMGNKTKFSMTESAQAFEYMAMAGWETKDMLNSIDGVMNLAAASGEDLGLVSDIVTDAMSAFGLAADGTTTVIKDGLNKEVPNATHFADVLAKAAASANTDVAKMGETFKYVAPVAGTLGYTIEDVGVTIGLMANQGIKASQAGTSLRTAMTNLSVGAGAAGEEMDKLGFYVKEAVTTHDWEKINKFGLTVAEQAQRVRKLKEKYEELAQSTKASQFEISEALNSYNLANDKLVYLQRDLDEMAKGETEWSVKYNEAIQNADGSMKSWGETLVFLRDKFKDLDQAQQTQAAANIFGKEAISGMLAVINSSDEDFNELIAKIQDSDGAAQEMADTMNDNLSGALTLLHSNLETAAYQIGSRMSPYIKDFAEWIQKLVEKFNSLDDKQLDMIVRIGTIIATVGPLLIIISKIITTVSTIAGAIGTVGGAISGLLTNIAVAHGGFTAFEGLLGILANAFAGISSVVGVVGSAIAGVFGTIVSVVGAPVIAVVAIIGGLIAIFTVLYKTNEDFRNKVTEIWNSIVEFFKKVVTWIIDLFQKMIDGFKAKVDGFLGIWQSIIDFIKGLSSKMREAGFGIIADLLDGITSAAQKVLDFMSGLADKIWSTVSMILGWFKDIITGANEASNASASVNGSHAGGLTYVPFDGYVARLHEGERVLTKEESEDYSRGFGKSGDTYNFYNTQPDPYEYSRQMRKAKRDLENVRGDRTW